MNVCLVPPRDLNDWERRLLHSLTSLSFPGSIELRQQIPWVSVAEEYPPGDPSVIFVVNRDASPPAQVEGRIPVEAEGKDDDGMPILILLHVIDGYLWELELFRGDSGSVLRLPEPEQLEFFAPPRS